MKTAMRTVNLIELCERNEKALLISYSVPVFNTQQSFEWRENKKETVK